MKLKPFLLFALFFLAFSGTSAAQNASADSAISFRPYRNSIYIELGGNAVFGSVNYERLFPYAAAPGTTLALRVGGFFHPGNNDSGVKNILIIPLESSAFWGRRAVKPELGFGLTYLQSYSVQDDLHEEGYKYTEFLPVFRFGLRYEKPGKPYVARLALTPLVIAVLEDPGTYMPPVLPWLGLSVGYHFGKQK